MSQKDFDKQLEMLTTPIERRLQQFEESFLRRIGERVDIITKLSGKTFDRSQINAAIEQDIYELRLQLMATDQSNSKDVEKLLSQFSGDIYRDAKKYYDAKGLEWVPYDSNDAVKQVADAVIAATKEHLTSLSKTNVIRLLDKNRENPVPYAKAYRSICNLASERVASGFTDYRSELRDILKQCSKSGVRVQYESGRTRRLDSAARMNLLDGVRAVNREVQNAVGKQFGADGYEISAHASPAPDHADIQGMQYSAKEYEELNRSLARPIGELNCSHFAFAILIGVSAPNYSKAELDEMKRANEQGFDYEGKHYTMYEGTQLQRQLETAIRYAKEDQIAAKAFNDSEWIVKAQDNIRQLTRQYRAVSKASGLSVKRERMSVSGYRAIDKFSQNGIIKAERSLQQRLDFALPNGEKGFIPKNAMFETVVTIAGNGSKKALRAADKLAGKYGGAAAEWKKQAGKIVSEKYIFDVHWYEKSDGVQYDVKLKKRGDKK